MFYIYAGNELLYEPGNSTLVVFTPKLTLEMGKAGSLEFSIPSSNPHYTELQQMKTILTVYMDDVLIFRGRVLSNKRNFQNIREVYAEGDLAYLVDSVQKAEKYTGKAHALFRNIIAAHNKMVADPTKKFSVGNITVDDRDVILVGQSDDTTYEEAETTKFDYKQIAINSVAEEWQNTFDYIESCLTDYCGGYLRTRQISTPNLIGNVTYVANSYYNDKGVPTEYNGVKRLDSYIQVKANEEYTISIDTQSGLNIRVHEYDANKNWIRQSVYTSERSASWKTASNTKYVRFSIPASSVDVILRLALTTCIDWLKDYYDTGSQTIMVGRNVLDLTEEVSIEDAFTVLIPIGDENLTIEKDASGKASPAFTENGIQHTAGSPELVDTAAVSKYGRIVKTNVFDGVNTYATLLDNAKRYLKNNVNIPTTVTVTAVDMHLVDPNIRAIYLGDRMLIESDYHSINDYYTCTKIEYDLGNPANNVYTFGQPKQTLTERYRKDKKKQSDSARRGGGGGAGGAGKASEKKTDKDLEEFFDAWINVDKSKGTIDLGTLYKKVKHGETILKNNCGIDLNAPKGTIDIFANHQKTEGLIKTLNHVGIKMNSEQGKIDLYADHKTTGDIVDVFKTAGVFVNATDGTVDVKSSVKNLKTEEERVARVYTWAGFDENGNLSTETGMEADRIRLTTLAREHEEAFQYGTMKWAQIAGIELDNKDGTATMYSKATGGAADVIAAFSTWAGYNKNTHQFETTAGINGDVITIGGTLSNVKKWKDANEEPLAKLVKINAELVNIAGSLKVDKSISADRTIQTSGYIICQTAYDGGSAGGQNRLTAANHTHLITETDGVVTIGKADITGKDHSFNIAETKFYKDGVSAVKVSSVSLDPLVAPAYRVTYNSSSKQYTAILSGKTDKGNEAHGFSVSFSGSAAYNAGVNDTKSHYRSVSVTKQGSPVSTALYYKLGSGYIRYYNPVYLGGSTSTYYTYS